MKYAWIKQHAPEFPIDVMCRFTKVSRSAYYACLNRPETRTEKNDAELASRIKSEFSKSQATYCTRRLREALLKQGLTGKSAKDRPFNAENQISL